MHVLVVGGGVIGCSIAYYLRREGIDVTLAERGRIGGEASSAAAGMLAPLAESAEPGAFSRLAQLGLRAFHDEAAELMDESGVNFFYRRDGIIRVAESEQEEQDLRSALPWQQEGGARVSWVDPIALRNLEPELSRDILGALYTEGEGHVDPVRLTQALATSARARGAVLIEGCEIEGFDRDRERLTAGRHQRGLIAADYFVIAEGAWAATSSVGLGSAIPVIPIRGQMAALSQITPALRHVVYSHAGYLVPKSDGSIYVGATEEEAAGFDVRVTAAGLHWLLGAAMRLVPALANAGYLRSWAGLRPCAPDRLPIIGPLPKLTNVAVATGHFRNGILLSLVTGRLIAAFLSTGVLAPDLSAFSPARFSQS